MLPRLQRIVSQSAAFRASMKATESEWARAQSATHRQTKQCWKRLGGPIDRFLQVDAVAPA